VLPPVPFDHFHSIHGWAVRPTMSMNQRALIVLFAGTSIGVARSSE
jgi:hypothetical protein